MKHKLLVLLSLAGPSTLVFANHAILGPCKCEASIEGEHIDPGTGEGDYATKDGTQVGGFAGTAELKFNIEQETDGRCQTNESPCVNQRQPCKMDYTVEATVTPSTGDPTPANIWDNGNLYPLSAVGDGSYYGKTDEDTTSDVHCEGEGGIPIKVKDASGNDLTSDSFKLLCAQCTAITG